MDESILNSVKKVLGIDPSYDDFDEDIKMSINSAIHTLYQLGYGNAKNFMVFSSEDTWEDLIKSDFSGIFSLIKTYIYTKVRMLFDPPTSSFVLTSLENQNKELEWRIYVEMEGGFDEQDEYYNDSCHSPGYIKSSGRYFGRGHDGHCGHHNPWEGVPRNGRGYRPGYLDSLRRLRDEMGRP